MPRIKESKSLLFNLDSFGNDPLDISHQYGEAIFRFHIVFTTRFMFAISASFLYFSSFQRALPALDVELLDLDLHPAKIFDDGVGGGVIFKRRNAWAKAWNSVDFQGCGKGVAES